jgi:4-amino-4-deoxy-L-arabinose transferase-like glycosyltransferase
MLTSRWATVFFSLLVLSPILLLPLSPDNSTYQSMGWELYHGGLPYLSSWDMNFPGVVYLHTLSIWLFGNSDLGFRTLDLFFNIGICVLLYSLVDRWYPKRAAIFSALLYALFYSGRNYWRVGQRDTFAVFFLLAGIYLLLLARHSVKSRTLLISSGAMLAFASVIRPTYALFCLVFPMLDAFQNGRKVRRAVIFLAGVVSIWAAILIPYAIQPGGLREFYNSAVLFNLDVYGMRAMSVQDVLHDSGPLKLLIGFVVALSVAIATIRVFKRSRGEPAMLREDRTLVSAYVICAALSVIAMRKFFSYHFEPLYAFAFCVAAVFLDKRIALLKRGASRRIAWIACIVLIAGLRFPFNRCLELFFPSAKAASGLQAGYASIASDFSLGYMAEAEVVSFLKSHTSSSDTIECCSVVAGVRWRAERPMATRFTTDYALVLSDKEGNYTDYQNAWRSEFVSRLSSIKPRYIVVEETETPFLKYFEKPLKYYLSSIEGFDSLIAADYASDTVIRGYRIYGRKQA